MVEKYKIVLCGEGNVGKTSLIHRFVKGTYDTNYKATIGVDIFKKTVELADVTVDLQIWDLGGQSIFSAVRKKFYNHVRGAILVFDLTMPSSFKQLSSWVNELLQSGARIPIILLGNKIDMIALKAVDEMEIKKWMENQPLIDNYYPTSALSGYNVEAAFKKLCEILIEKNEE